MLVVGDPSFSNSSFNQSPNPWNEEEFEILHLDFVLDKSCNSGAMPSKQTKDSERR